MTENEMTGWYHRLNGHEFEQTLGNSELRELVMDREACFMGPKASDTTEGLN